MNRLVRSLFAAAATTAALAAFPANASASPDREPHPAVPAHRLALPPAPHVAPARRLEERERASRELRERASRELRELASRELRELALARERFYAAHPTRWEVARFERWHTSRRAELERRWGFPFAGPDTRP